MPLNDIQLSGQLLEALYGNVLVVHEESNAISNPVRPETPAKPAAQAIQFLGKNNRHFVVLVNYPGLLHLPDEGFNFLGSVLKACQLNAADIAIVNLASQSVSLPAILQQFQPVIILGFGTGKALDGLPDQAPLQPIREGQFQYMTGPALEAFHQGGDAAKPLKKQLWDGLKFMLQL